MKDELIRLQKYESHIKDKISGQTPEKHKNRDSNYRQFLSTELKKVQTKINNLKLEVTK